MFVEGVSGDGYPKLHGDAGILNDPGDAAVAADAAGGYQSMMPLTYRIYSVVARMGRPTAVRLIEWKFETADGCWRIT